MTTLRRTSRGYTVVEVLVGISLLIIASSGIVALQKVTAQGNGHARELAVASQIARSWVDRLRTDATTWNFAPKDGTASDISQTIWLQNVTSAPMTWFRPNWSTLGNGGAVFASPGADIYGRDLGNAGLLDQAFYCTHLRLSWMYPNEVIRAEVRVVWQRAGGLGGFGGLPVCSAQQNLADFSAVLQQPLSRYNFTYLVSSILRNKPVLQ